MIDINKEVSAEHRKHERYHVNLKTYIRLSDGSVTHAQTIDISMGGAYLEYGAPAEEGKVFELAFDLVFMNEFKRVLVKACVVRSVVIGGRELFGLGFAFLAFHNDTDKILEEYIQLRQLKTL